MGNSVSFYSQAGEGSALLQSLFHRQVEADGGWLQRGRLKASQGGEIIICIKDLNLHGKNY
jgi:hypothetical protein